MNDLHTADLAAALADASGAAALINVDVDRNDVDLNRLSAAHDAMPRFLEALADLVEAACARHGRATLVTVHGWNVVEPRVDVGLGCLPGAEPLAVPPTAAVSPAFARTGVGALVRACDAHDIHATVGARYPARARENLVQLFTRRHRDDPRPLVRRLVASHERCDALQLELGIPLRWPGAWRDRLAGAWAAALPALCGAAAPVDDVLAVPLAAPAPRALSLAGRDARALLAVDPLGARLLLFPGDGTLLLFTAEHAGSAHPALGLHIVDDGDGVVASFRGPVARCPDTTPFVDLEHGLARATIVDDVHLALRFAPDLTADGGRFGVVRGAVHVGPQRIALDGTGFLGTAMRGAGTRGDLRLTLRLGPERAVAVTVSAGGAAEGSVAGPAGTRRVRSGRAVLGPAHDPLGRIRVALALDDETLRLDLVAVDRLPVVRSSAPPNRHLWASCRLADHAQAVGWCELAAS
ncbi:MAG: hypothetical protein KIT14_24255 [bacterium]|nr:hypothetical protein [bacterium]